MMRSSVLRRTGANVEEKLENMRSKKIEGTPRVILNMKEAHDILDILNDYSWRMGEIEGFTEEARDADKLYEELDEAIMKAEAI